MTEQFRAAVMGNALMSFFPDVDKEMREQVQTCLLYTSPSPRD